MLLQGILLGFSLSFLIGPLLFSIVEAGISQGFRAGFAVAAGIWISDVLFMLLAIYGVEALEALVHLPGFRLWAGIVGGGMLMGFGFSSLLLKKKTASELNDLTAPKKEDRLRSYKGWWFRGFLLNTVNPGTILFWLGIVSGVVVPSGWRPAETLIFFGGMLGTLVITDTLKAWAAKHLRRFLTPRHTLQIQRSIGLLMLVFGVVLFIRAVVMGK